MTDLETDPCAPFMSMIARAARGDDEPDTPLDAEEQARLDAHLASCPACADAMADQHLVRTMLRSQPVQGASPGFQASVMAQIRAEQAAAAPSWFDSLDFRRWTWRLVPVAAALALVAVSVAPTDAASAGTEAVPASSAATTSATVADTDNLPVSSALWSDTVSESSLLSLMLSASADDTLADHRKDPS